MRPLVHQQFEVGQWVTVDEQDIRIGAACDHAEFTLPIEQLGIHGGGGSDDVGCALDLGPDQKLLRLRVVGLSEQVGPEPDLHTGVDRDPDRAPSRMQHVLELPHARFGEVELPTELRAISLI